VNLITLINNKILLNDLYITIQDSKE
jgi:hypothetical protein